MTIEQIQRAVETKTFRKGSSALSTAERLKREGVSRDTIDRISGSDWYEFVKACSDDLVD